jgi:hypothetical protein
MRLFHLRTYLPLAGALVYDELLYPKTAPCPLKYLNDYNR